MALLNIMVEGTPLLFLRVSTLELASCQMVVLGILQPASPGSNFLNPKIIAEYTFL